MRKKHICRTCAPCAISGAPRKKYYCFWRFANFFLSLIYCTRVSLHLSFSIIYWPPHTRRTRKHTHLHTQGLSPRNTAVRHPNGIILSLRIHIMYTTGIYNIIYFSHTYDDDEVLVWVYNIILHRRRTFRITRTRRKLCNRRGAWVAAAYPLYGHTHTQHTTADIGYTRKHMVGISNYTA